MLKSIMTKTEQSAHLHLQQSIGHERPSNQDCNQTMKQVWAAVSIEKIAHPDKFEGENTIQPLQQWIDFMTKHKIDQIDITTIPRDLPPLIFDAFALGLAHKPSIDSKSRGVEISLPNNSRLVLTSAGNEVVYSDGEAQTLDAGATRDLLVNRARQALGYDSYALSDPLNWGTISTLLSSS